MLSQLASKKTTFNDVIRDLIRYYVENEELAVDELGKYHNVFDKIETTFELRLIELESRIENLEKIVNSDEIMLNNRITATGIFKED